MSDTYLIIDIGTSSLRVALLDEQRSIITSQTIKRSAPPVFDADSEWALIYQMIRTICSEHRSLKAIAVSSLLGWVGIDYSGAAVTPCYSYMHQESAQYQAFCLQHHPHSLYDICKRQLAPEQLAFKLQRIKKEDPCLYERLQCFVSLKDYINLKLTGIAALDHTTASYTMLYDVCAGSWSDSCLRTFDLDAAHLPQLLHPWEPLGPLRPDLCADLALTQSCPVAVGSVDGSCGILGAGGTLSGTMVSVMGTTDTCFLVQDSLPDDKTCNLVVNPHVIPGLFLAGGPMGMYGGTLEWMLNNLTQGASTLPQMNQLASEIPAGSCGVLAFPSLAGERTPFWAADMRGTFLGLTHESHSGHVFRAILEANCYATRRIVDLLEDGNSHVKQVLATGGGSQSDLWLQLKSDILKVPVMRSNAKEATLEGTGILAMMASGTPLEKISLPPAVQTFPVRPDSALAYDSLYSSYLRVHDILLNIYPVSNNT